MTHPHEQIDAALATLADGQLDLLAALARRTYHDVPKTRGMDDLEGWREVVTVVRQALAQVKMVDEMVEPSVAPPGAAGVTPPGDVAPQRVEHHHEVLRTEALPLQFQLRVEALAMATRQVMASQDPDEVVAAAATYEAFLRQGTVPTKNAAATVTDTATCVFCSTPRSQVEPGAVCPERKRAGVDAPHQWDDE